MKKIYTDTYQWKWVCVQHPMVLISSDMSTPRALETVPPWGANDVPGYCRKMYHMLLKIDQTPDMKADFDLAAKEMLIFFENVPEGKTLIKKLYDDGKLGFVGTDYSQAHYGTARSESALRGIRMGNQVYKDELGVETDTFCHQEVGVFENLPQILKAFGVKKAACHRFPVCFEFLEPSLEIYSHFGELCLVHDETMANWCGLDGTCIPMYLPYVNNRMLVDLEVMPVFEKVTLPEFKCKLQPPFSEVDKLYPTDAEECKGMYHGGSIIIQIPDMVKLDADYMDMRRNVGEFWKLSDAIDEEMRHCNRMPKMHYYSYFSYAEGAFGEVMFKAYRPSEEKILAAETMQVIANKCGLDLKFDSWSAWDKLLTAQHHDINDPDHTELKMRAYSWTQQAEKDSKLFISAAEEAIINKNKGEKQLSAIVFNTLPIRRTALVSLPIANEENYRVFDGEKELPSQIDDGKLVFKVTSEGLGFKSYKLEKTAENIQKIAVNEPYHFENDVMSVTVLPDGRLSELSSKFTGDRLDGYGNVIRGKLVLGENDEKWISNENSARSFDVVKGKLFDKLTVNGQMENIPFVMTIRLPHGNGNRIDFEVDFDFNKNEIGDILHDNTKLNLYWDLKDKPSDILFDEPFGIAHGRAERSLLAANFIAAFKDGAGVAFHHDGTPKCWIEGKKLVNQLAWGGDRLSNRMTFCWTGMDIYDRRLEGKMHYSYSISIEENDEAASLVTESNSRITPLLAAKSEYAVPEKLLMKLLNLNYIPTAVEKLENDIIVRAFDVSGKSSEVKYQADMECICRTDVAGKTKTGNTIDPYEIFELRFR